MDIQKIKAKLKNIFNLKTPNGLFYAALSILISIRLVYIALPSLVAWDATVYMGMAEYLASSGQIGLWEFFRPPLLPLLFSISKLIQVPIVFWAELLTFLASVGSLFLIYKIGEKIRPFAGAFAAFALGISTLFMSFSSVPMTEVFGIFFSLSALYLLFIKNSYFWAGMVSGLCFLTRFPYGLLAPIFYLSFLYFDWRNKDLWKVLFLRTIYFLSGFSILAVAYLISNYFLYGDVFSPLVSGVKVIEGAIWIYRRKLGFYENVLFLQNPLFIFSLVTVFLAWFRGYFSENKRVIYLLFIWFLVFFTYFYQEEHKEARYIITVFPALALLSGISISYFYEKHKRIFFLVGIAALALVSFLNTHFFVQPKNIVESFENFYSLLQKEYGKTVITSTPVVAVYSPVKVLPAYDRFEFFKNKYEENRLKAGYLLIDSCELHVCPPGEEDSCANHKRELLDEIFARESVIYDKTVGICRHVIAEIKK